MRPGTRSRLRGSTVTGIQTRSSESGYFPCRTSLRAYSPRYSTEHNNNTVQNITAIYRRFTPRHVPKKSSRGDRVPTVEPIKRR